MSILVDSRRRCRWLWSAVFVSLILLAPCANAAISITTTLPGYSSLNSVIQPVLFQATGAATSLQWSVSSGSLPPGLTLAAGGLFSGTPSAAGTYTFTVMAAAPGVTPGTKTFTIGVPQITTASTLPVATVGVPYSVQLLSSDGPATGAVWSVSYGGLPNGLVIDPRTGVYSGTPTLANTYTLAVSVSFGVAFATKTISLTINPPGQGLTVAPSSLQFQAVVGNISGQQDLTVSAGAGPPLSFTALVDDGKGGPAPGWLKVTPQGGATPSVLRVSLVAASLSPATYSARIRISLAATAAALPPVDVSVSLTIVNPPPNLTVAPSILRYTARVSNSGTQDQTFLLQNTGGGGATRVSLSVAGNSPWIVGVSASAQNVTPGNPVLIKVTIDSQGLAVGSYRDAVRIATPLAAPFDRFDVPVSLAVAGQGSIMSVGLSGVRFATGQGDLGSRTQQISVFNSGDPGSTVNWTAQAVQGADVVTLTNPGGSSRPGNPSSFGVGLSSTAANSAGGKFALIQVTDPQSQNGTQFVVVVADVAASGAPPIPDPVPAGLAFFATGATPPPAQPVTVGTNSAAPVAFSVSVSTDDGGSWLSAKAGAAATSQANPAQVSVSVTPGSLVAGVYTGTVNIGIGAAARGVKVTMVLPPAATGGGASTARLNPRAAACSPSVVVLSQAGVADNFSVPAGWPAALIAQVTDNCGTALPNASVVASFSNGDAPLSLRGDGQSATYSAAWQPGRASSAMTVTLDAVSGSLTPDEVKLVGTVQPNASPAPSLVTGGLLNNLNPQVGAAIAPGTIAQIYGDNLAGAPDQPSDVPLPVIFDGVQALVGGLSAPLFYISKTQLVAQIPAELTPNRTYSALVIVGNQYTLPQDIDISPVTPGTVVFADGTLVAQHRDYTLVDATQPAEPGETLTIYLVGMGATTPPVASGAAAPSDPPAQASSQPQVTVDGIPASVGFAGLTPGGVGLYQINFTVPPGARSGTLDVVISQGGIAANATKLIVGP